MGLAELASLYANTDERLLMDVIRQIGVQLPEEHDSEMQSLVGAAFVRMSQEATKKRSFAAIQRSVEMIDYVETERPEMGNSLRPRIAIESRLPEFIEEALKDRKVQSGFADLLRRIPLPASEQLAARFSRSGFREDWNFCVSMMNLLGPEGLSTWAGNSGAARRTKRSTHRNARQNRRANAGEHAAGTNEGMEANGARSGGASNCCQRRSQNVDGCYYEIFDSLDA